MSRRSIPKETKEAVVKAMKVVGARSVEVAEQFGVSLPTVYNWVKQTKTLVTSEVKEKP